MLAHRMLLMRLGILDCLSEEQISSVRENLRTQRLMPGETLFAQGERCEHLHIIQDGALQLVAGEGDSQRVCEVVMSGHVLGEVGVFMGMPYPCTARASEECVVSSLHRNDLRRLTEGLPSFGWQLLRLFSRRLAGMQIRVQALSTPDVATRVSTILLQLSQDMGDHLPGRPITLNVRQSELGQMAGVTRETVSRLLSDWSRAGWLSVGRGRVVIGDLHQLQSVAEGSVGPREAEAATEDAPTAAT